MNRNNVGMAFALCLLAAGTAGADDSAQRSCIADWTTSCSRECATPKCVSNCTTQAHDQCKKDLTQPQHVFVGPVTATPTDSCDASSVLACTPFVNNNVDVTVAPPAACTTVRGTVANQVFWGGFVTIRVICPAGAPIGNAREGGSTTIIGQTTSSCADGTFTLTATNACSGQTGCYGLISADAPNASFEQGCPNIAAPLIPGDPGWNTCTASCCPSL